MSNASLSTVPSAQRVAITNEKVTGPPAAEMLRLSDIAEAKTVEVLDNASGAGILVDHLLRLSLTHNTLQIKQVVAGDLDETILSFISKKQEAAATSSAWKDVAIKRIDQQSIPYGDATFTHVFSNFGIFFCRDDTKALSEAYRVLRRSGTAGFTSWKAITWWSQVAEPALAQHFPEAPKLPSPAGIFPSPGWNELGAIPPKLREVGFENIRVSEYSFAPRVKADEFAEAIAVLIKVVAKRVWPDEIFVKYAGKIEEALLRYLHDNYEGGIWDGKMTAIISLGRKDRL